jgi:pyruvate/2-oxoglutarate dehydrogenase complex dihydrolipoamide dehydrogenase (E3) component
VVIGAGTAGLVTAAGAAGLGAKVALIERDLLGGDCLLRSAKLAPKIATKLLKGMEEELKKEPL